MFSIPDDFVFYLSVIGFGWYAALWAIVVLGAVAARRRYRNRPKFLLNFTPSNEAPGVSILRPLKGLDANLYTNLESTFRQEYPNFEIIFSVASEQDQALPIVRELVGLYPHTNARIIIGEEEVGVNPKVNNLIRPYRMASHDILWVLDSNVFVEPGVLARAVEALTSQKDSSSKRVGVVHHVPYVDVAGSSWGSRIEAAFLNTTHAKMYIAINTVAVESCVVGKSCLYRRSDVDRVNGSLKPRDGLNLDVGGKSGLSAFGTYLAEDNMIASALWHELELRHDLSCDVAHNSVGNMSVSDYIWRRVRWIRVRKHMVLLATIVEPFTESILLAIIGGGCTNRLFSLPRSWVVTVHFILWFLVDVDVYRSLSGLSFSAIVNPHFVVAWMLRELLTFPVFIFAIFGNTVVWRGQRYRILRNGETALATGV